MQPSIYQQKVIDWMSDEQDLSDKVVNSVAGSGKSTLLKLVADAIAQLNQDLIEQSLVLVFNRKNKDALVAKLTPRWKNSISTVHSAGYKMLRRYLGVQRLEVNEHKYRILAKNLNWFNGTKPNEAKVVSLSNFLKLADFVRQTLSDTSYDALLWLVNHYALDIQTKYLIEIGEQLQYLFRMGSDWATEAVIDHTDMLWLPIHWQINRSPGFKHFQRVMVDEAQDMSKLQLEFVLSLTTIQGKMLFVGDPAQSINGFCGADTDSFANIKQRLKAEEFILPICYRCPVSHIELINQLYPEIPIKQRENAPPGRIEVIAESALWQPESEARVRPKDLIIARCTSTLVDLNLKLITRGIACNLVGSTLKQTLLELLEDIASQPDFCYQEFLRCSQAYLEFKRSLYEANDNGSILLMQLQDKIKALKAIYQHFAQCQSLEELVVNIERLFGSEDNEAVLLSTIHRAKGMEAARVFIAEPLSLPLIWDNQKPWQEQQEHNLLYVALSRSTQDLFLIGDALWFDGNLQPQESSVEFPASYSTPNFKQLIAKASAEELFEYQESLQLEMGKRIASKFQDLLSSNSVDLEI
ncbi:MAG: UvrD-helicase domain-containing protein [Waterburya sp.]